MTKTEVVLKNKDKIVDLSVKVHKEMYRFCIDIYAYEDGTVDYFCNPGKNSWLNDDHVFVLSIDNQFTDSEETELFGDPEYESSLREYFEELVNTRVRILKEEEEWEY